VLLVLEEAHNPVSLSDQKNQRFALVMMPWHFLGRGMETRGFTAAIIHCYFIYLFIFLCRLIPYQMMKIVLASDKLGASIAEPNRQINKINFPRR
jgi:hypothetical protein